MSMSDCFPLGSREELVRECRKNTENCVTVFLPSPLPFEAKKLPAKLIYTCHPSKEALSFQIGIP